MEIDIYYPLTLNYSTSYYSENHTKSYCARRNTSITKNLSISDLFGDVDLGLISRFYVDFKKVKIKK